MGHNRPDYVHTVVEAMKLGLADRDTYYADPLFVDVPLQALLSTGVRRSSPAADRPGKGLAGTAAGRSAWQPRPPRQEPQAYRLPGGPIQDTTTCLVADREGNVVAATPSGWDGVLAGRTGVVLGSRLRSFNTWPGHPNCIEPGKRPRITLTPTLVFRQGRPVAAISVAGGDQQDQVTLQLLLGLHRVRPVSGRGGHGPAVHHRTLRRLVQPAAGEVGQPVSVRIVRPGRRSTHLPPGGIASRCRSRPLAIP